MDAFIGAVRTASRVLGVAAAALIALGVLVVCQMVFVRYVLGHNTIWQTDFVTYSLVAAAFIGSPYVLMTRGHVNVDVLPHYAGRKLRYRLAVFAALVALVFALAMAVLTFLFWKEAWDNRWVSDTMWRARLWIPYASMPIGLTMLALQCLADLLALLSGREPPFGMAEVGR
ncbi:MAG: TRAP transporter small permease [Ideonella sp.]|nr:TRAP transporter small permease [Ideonella sp.]MCC7458922.1 TRAP transporter small permease [Nitrospira sp.]